MNGHEKVQGTRSNGYKILTEVDIRSRESPRKRLRYRMVCISVKYRILALQDKNLINSRHCFGLTKVGVVVRRLGGGKGGGGGGEG